MCRPHSSLHLPQQRGWPSAARVAGSAAGCRSAHGCTLRMLCPSSASLPLQGGYIANQVDPAGLDPAARWRAASYLQTRVSHTGGATWAPLAAPATYRHARCKACEPGAQGGCDLHLHGPTSWQAPEGARRGAAQGVCGAAGQARDRPSAQPPA
jgi:hypothetical protein